jgi:A/G-specific adenine glycosylase
VLVSEQMLQQTQVARVLPRYEAFLERFPTVAACAAASAGDVVRLWDGLGYNTRAVRLHAAAVAVTERHGGTVPGSLPSLLALPGLGPYTARAVLAFAYEDDGAAVVDVNVARVLQRLAGTQVPPREVQRTADGLVPRGRSWLWNQSLMEVGATVCRSRTPRCEVCPLAASCAWLASGLPAPDPGRARATQSAFEGSDRQGRGRLVAALRRGEVGWEAVPTVAGWPDDPQRSVRVARSLVRDGVAVDGGDVLRLP